MASSTLTVISATPQRVLFQWNTSGGDPAKFLKSGASRDDEKDLSSLAAGPLRSYLAKLTNWSVVPPGYRDAITYNTRIAWRFGYGGEAFNLPLYIATGETMCESIMVQQYKLTGVQFVSPLYDQAINFFIEMCFLPSQVR